MQPILVILAAGLGRRFGGDKQLSGIGPTGHPLLAYAIHDAHRAGFGRAVVVVREGLEPLLRQRLVGAQLPIDYAVQVSDRARPWGTGHAVLAVAGQVQGPFMVVNADDFYGASTYLAMADFLSAARVPGPPTFAIAGFPLGETLSAEGPVNRGICRLGPEGWLAEIREVEGILMGSTEPPPETPVSLNAWGFGPELFPLLKAGFAAFRERAGPEEEFLLPEVINDLVASGRARVRILATSGPWIGVTWPADMPRAAAHLARIRAAGEYQAMG